MARAGESASQRRNHCDAIELSSQCRMISHETLEGVHDLAPFDVRLGAIRAGAIGVFPEASPP
jgi:hypothetical protein